MLPSIDYLIKKIIKIERLLLISNNNRSGRFKYIWENNLKFSKKVYMLGKSDKIKMINLIMNSLKNLFD